MKQYKLTLIFKPIDRGAWKSNQVGFPPWFEQHLEKGAKDFTPVADQYEIEIIDSEDPACPGSVRDIMEQDDE